MYEFHRAKNIFVCFYMKYYMIVAFMKAHFAVNTKSVLLIIYQDGKVLIEKELKREFK